mmetsp:Transcript_12618/g.18919  ORF Transcript_12618/g.18919 Transcript_12618/m.18919 type:complete len:314 (+) Transcript_12618:145-1086(+)
MSNVTPKSVLDNTPVEQDPFLKVTKISKHTHGEDDSMTPTYVQSNKSLSQRFQHIQDDRDNAMTREFSKRPSSTTQKPSETQYPNFGTTLVDDDEEDDENDFENPLVYRTNAHLHPHPPIIDFSQYQEYPSYPLEKSIIRTSEPIQEEYKNNLIPAPEMNRPSVIKSSFSEHMQSWDELENMPWYQREYHHMQFSDDHPFSGRPGCSPTEKLQLLREHEKKLRDAYLKSQYEANRGPKSKWYTLSTSEFSRELQRNTNEIRTTKKKRRPYKPFRGPIWVPTFQPSRNFDGSSHYRFGEACGNKLSFAGTGEPE